MSRNPAVSIIGIIGGVSVAIVLIFAIFARENLGIAGWIITSLALMGAVVAPIVGRRH